MTILHSRERLFESAVPAFPQRRIGRLDIAAIDEAEALAQIQEAVGRRSGLHVAFVNAHCVNLAERDTAYRETMGSFLCLADGIGVDVGSRVLYGARFPANLNGTDLVPRILETANAPLRVALVGGEPGIVERAAIRFSERYPRHRFIAVSHGFFSDGNETELVLADLRNANADLLLVALGVPAQEHFIARHIGAREAAVALGVGALLDFTAGKVVRAPGLMRSLRIEWIFRMAQEPRRLGGRYLLGNPAFLLTVLKQKLRSRRR